MIIDNIKLSQRARDQLITLKRRTGIKNWNVLCRWGFCVSLAEKTAPTNANVPADSSVEMTWRVFAGRYDELYMAVLKERCRVDSVDLTDDNIARQFRLHLHRGIAYLAGDKKMRGTADLMTRIAPTLA